MAIPPTYYKAKKLAEEESFQTLVFALMIGTHKEEDLLALQQLFPNQWETLYRCYLEDELKHSE